MTAVSLLVLCFLVVANISVSFCNGNFHVGCIENEKQTLLKFKQDLIDPSNLLASWSDDGDCCMWSGVVCHNLTGHVHVHGIHLQNPYADYQTNTKFKVYQRSKLSGKVSPSLLNLKHLSYLDLSDNDFQGIQIPKFFGSMRSLRYLNLSHADFRGMIPHQFGNLSNLHYLSLRNNYLLNVDSFQWLAGLSSLQHLDMSNINLSKASDWLQVTNTLPSLAELHLSNCQLQNFHLLHNVNFSSLVRLDLSGNSFDDSLFPRWVFDLNTLVYLDLGDNEFQGPIPSGLQNITALNYLALFGNYFNSSIPNWLYSFPNLEFLNLGYNNLQGKITSAIDNQTSVISHLDLGGNSFQGPIPSGLQNITSLNYLDLHYNHFNSSIPNWLYGFPSLEFLNLGYNNLQGKISSAIENLTSVISLDLSYNELEGEFPTSLGKLCNLKSISLVGIKINHELSQVLGNLLGCVSNGLESLDLRRTQLSGQLTDQLGQFKKLTQLDLSSNLISGPIPVSIGELSSLRELDLSNNSLNGTFLESFGQLSKLEILCISKNLLKGVVSEIHFANLTRLIELDASGNSLSLRVSPFWVPPFQLGWLDLGSWHLGPQFPLWLHSQKYIFYLDVSNARISDTIPTWLWNMSSQLIYLNLSHNQIHGKIPDILRTSSSIDIDLNSNQFEGPLPCFSSNVSSLDLSNNLLSGSISHFLCYQINDPKGMRILKLGGNHLSGELPDCWMSWQWLMVINLSNNSFTGNIPSSMGTVSHLESLHLRNNKLSGELPLSLSNCTNLETIDFGVNELVGAIPSWIGKKLLNLMILSLRSNKFYGQIPDELCALTSLQILDLANNSLYGTIPRCVSNFSAMITKNSSSDDLSFYIWYARILEDALLVRKGQFVEYSTTLKYVKVLDLSDNKLFGEVPTEVTSLQGLQSLNLSNNLLTGRIPQNIGAMDSVESVDLSVNQLSGEIPASMSSLTFLSRLNLSYNHLRGKIPLGTQLQSFDASSFIGNQLCGPPLMENCSANGIIPSGGGKTHNGLEVDWFYLSMALGFVVGFWGAVGSLLFNRPWRIVFFQFMDHMWLMFLGFISKCNKILVA